jgi:hypothetical protein
VPNAIVMFTPADDSSESAKKLRPFAYADVQGNFELKTYKDGDGAPPGKYRVSIMVASATPRAKGGKDQRSGDSENTAAQSVNIPPAVSKKYGSADTSGIEVTVEDGENNLEPFDLAPGAGAPRQSVRLSGPGTALIRN